MNALPVVIYKIGIFLVNFTVSDPTFPVKTAFERKDFLVIRSGHLFGPSAERLI